MQIDIYQEKQRLEKEYHKANDFIEAIAKNIAEKHTKKLAELHLLCLKQHKTHEDDGSMFGGFCRRCGEYLG